MLELALSYPKGRQRGDQLEASYIGSMYYFHTYMVFSLSPRYYRALNPRYDRNKYQTVWM